MREGGMNDTATILDKMADGLSLHVNCTVSDGFVIEKTFAWLYVPVKLEVVGIVAPHIELEDVAMLERRGMIRPLRFKKGGLVLYPDGMRRNYTIEYERVFV
jgi:hypothetical protein